MGRKPCGEHVKCGTTTVLVSCIRDVTTRMILRFENYFNCSWFKGPRFLSLFTAKREYEKTKASNLNKALQQAKINKFEKIDIN